MNENLRELLYRSYDSDLSLAERTELNRALAASPELRAEQQEIERLRDALGQSAAAGFSLGFAERVLGLLPSPAPRRSKSALVFLSMQQTFRWVAAAGVAACTIMVVWNLKRLQSDRAFADDSVWETPVESMLEEAQ